MAIELPKTEPSMQNRRVVALVSGGKDSLFNLYLAKEYYKNEIVALVNLKPPPTAESDEMDSYMYQTVGHQAIESIAEAIDLPLYRATITGKETNTDLVYKNDDQRDDEVEQLHALLRKMLDDGLKFDAISVGAIASSYQKHRVEHVCERLNLKMLAYLWDQDQDKLLQAMIDSGFNAILIKVACMGLTEQHVGRSIKDMQDLLRKLNREYRTNICGEGGEYETLVLDCPLYKKALKLESYEIICHSHDVFAPVYYMKPTKISLVEVDENRFDKRRNSASSNSNSTSSSSPVANFNSKS